MNLKQLKAYLESKDGVLSCENYDASIRAIDFSALDNAEPKVSNDFGIPCWGKPALSIDNGTATIRIRGLLVPDVGFDLVEFGITGYDVIEHYLAYAHKSYQVEQIVLDIDSGGGYAKGVQHCADMIMNHPKPIHTFVSGDMYSAAYWLGCSAKQITTSAYSGVGSIGVYIEHFDRSEALKKMGIVARIFRSGKWKGAFGDTLPLTAEEQNRLQQDVEVLANDFFTHVANRRRLSKEVVGGFEGDTFTAEKAFELGLIDRIDNVTKTEVGGELNMEQINMTEQSNSKTTEDIEKIKAQAREEVLAELKAKEEREQKINALETSVEVKKVLSSSAFAHVEIDAMQELVNAMPKGFSLSMEETGGAGVSADPKGFGFDTKAQEALDKQAASLAKLASLKGKGL